MKSLFKQIEKMNFKAFSFLKYWLMILCTYEIFILVRTFFGKSTFDFLNIQSLRLEQFYIVVTLCLVVISSVIIDCVISKKIV